jgi:surface-anchored protein
VIRYLQTNGVIPNEHRSITLPAGFHDHFNWGFSSTGLYHVTFQAVGRRGEEITNVVSPEVTVAFQILPLRPYETWITTNWLPAEPRPVVQRAADADGDGAANLWEYIGGTRPGDATSSPANPQLVIVEPAGQRFAELRFMRRRAATDTTFRLALADQAGGPYALLDVPVVVIQSDATTETIALRDPLPITDRSARFYRLLVDLVSPAYW